MRIRALSTFTHPGENGMIVLNAAKGKVKAGEADLPDDIAQGYIDAGMAEKAKATTELLPHDGSGAPGGPVLETVGDLIALRTAYKAKVGKAPYHAWTADQLREKIDAAPVSDADEDKTLAPIDGPAGLVLITIDDDFFVVNAPWLGSPEPFATSEEAEARQLELRKAGSPEGWEPAEEGSGAPGGVANEDAAP